MPEPTAQVRVNAKEFQEPLEKLANTLVQTLMREGHKYIAAPPTVPDDIAFMVRHSVSIYRLLFYLNADVRRQTDTDWNERYGVTASRGALYRQLRCIGVYNPSIGTNAGSGQPDRGHQRQ